MAQMAARFLSFSPQNALYYSFYLDVVRADSSLEAIEALM